MCTYIKIDVINLFNFLKYILKFSKYYRFLIIINHYCKNKNQSNIIVQNKSG